MFLLISVIISFSFLTLFERKIIAVRQIRLSPQINLYNGLSQPFLDALKLLTKSSVSGEEKFFLNKYLIFFSVLFLIIYFHFWMVFFLCKGESLNSGYRIMCFLALLRISLYSIIFLRFFSLSKYPFFSLYRSVRQSISYEINFSLIIFLIIILVKTLNFRKLSYLENYFLFHAGFLVLVLIVRIIESFRSPFDFRESESELVSGFTRELGSLKFIFIFMAEYRILLFYIVFISLIFLFYTLIIIIFVSFFFMFRRSVLPRVRYDYLIDFCWKNLFSYIVFLFFLYFI